MANKVNHNHTYPTRAVISLRPYGYVCCFPKIFRVHGSKHRESRNQYNPLNIFRNNVDKHEQSFTTVKKRKDFQCPMINIKLKLIHVNYA